jgi:hypothetical protein
MQRVVLPVTVEVLILLNSSSYDPYSMAPLLIFPTLKIPHLISYSWRLFCYYCYISKDYQGVREGNTMSTNYRALQILSVMVFGALFISASSIYADTIYLKDGTMIKGAIKSEDEKTILIETGNTWKRVDKSNIESMNKDAVPAVSAEKQADTNVQAQQPSAATSASVTDLRVKFGSAAKIDTLSEQGFPDISVKAEDSSNVQIEVNTVMYGQSSVGLLLSGGLFVRKHSGSSIYQPQNKIDYDAAGFSFGIGMGIKASDHLHFEGKVELGLGAGNATVTGYTGTTESGSYASVSFIAGAYFTVSKPGLQIGLELGSQSFEGKFKDNGIYDASVKGSSGTANLVVGYRF